MELEAALGVVAAAAVTVAAVAADTGNDRTPSLLKLCKKTDQSMQMGLFLDFSFYLPYKWIMIKTSPKATKERKSRSNQNTVWFLCHVET